MRMEPIHIKIDFSDAKNSRKDLLLCEMNFLKMVEKLKNYRELRQKEFSEKNKLKNKVKEINLGVRRFKNKIPKIKSAGREKEEIKESIHDIEKKSSIELELKEIKEKLDRLG
ncbi:hypothetical protein HYW76_01250 [Candidatus Pacearchaeota archaeon]|nr:hypothetical protein [Candidatus Pacearchaeota archaeon]